jgi:hypothetical protein
MAAADPTKQECIDENGTAQDLVRDGKLLEARQKLTVCVSPACPGPVREDCAQRLNDLESMMPSVSFAAKDSAGNDLIAVSVTMDGQPFAEKLSATATEVNPGEHRFAFTAPGLHTTERVVLVREGEKGRLVEVVLGPAALAQPSHPLDLPPAGPPPPDGSTQRIVGLTLGSIGLVGLVAGTVFGVLSKSTYDHALQSECGNNPAECSAQGTTDGQTAYTEATVSTLGFIAGGALLAVGAIVYFTAPRSPLPLRVTPTVGSGGGGLRVEAAF